MVGSGLVFDFVGKAAVLAEVQAWAQRRCTELLMALPADFDEGAYQRALWAGIYVERALLYRERGRLPAHLYQEVNRLCREVEDGHLG